MTTLASSPGTCASRLTAEACEQGSTSPEALDHCRCPCQGSRHGWGRDMAEVPAGDPHYVPGWVAPERTGRYSRGGLGRSCPVCGSPLAGSRSRTCSPRCRQAAYRARVAAL